MILFAHECSDQFPSISFTMLIENMHILSKLNAFLHAHQFVKTFSLVLVWRWLHFVTHNYGFNAINISTGRIIRRKLHKFKLQDVSKMLRNVANGPQNDLIIGVGAIEFDYIESILV